MRIFCYIRGFVHIFLAENSFAVSVCCVYYAYIRITKFYIYKYAIKRTTNSPYMLVRIEDALWTAISSLKNAICYNVEWLEKKKQQYYSTLIVGVTKSKFEYSLLYLAALEGKFNTLICNEPKWFTLHNWKTFSSLYCPGLGSYSNNDPHYMVESL